MKSNRIKVKVVQRNNQASLVEWITEDGDLRRATVPSAVIINGACDSAELEYGIPYGVAWEQLITARDDFAPRLARELRRRGIWTVEELEANPNAVLGAIQAAHGVDLAVLLRAARQYGGEA